MDRGPYFCCWWGFDCNEGVALIDHVDCPVDGYVDSAALRRFNTDPAFVALWRYQAQIDGVEPLVCSCECTVCKRAWIQAGRPIVSAGKVVRVS